ATPTGTGTSTTSPPAAPVPSATAAPVPSATPSRSRTATPSPSATSAPAPGRSVKPSPAPTPSPTAEKKQKLPPESALRAYCRAYLEGKLEEDSKKYGELVDAAGGVDHLPE